VGLRGSIISTFYYLLLTNEPNKLEYYITLGQNDLTVIGTIVY